MPRPLPSQKQRVVSSRTVIIPSLSTDDWLLNLSSGSALVLTKLGWSLEDDPATFTTLTPVESSGGTMFFYWESGNE